MLAWPIHSTCLILKYMKVSKSVSTNLGTTESAFCTIRDSVALFFFSSHFVSFWCTFRTICLMNCDRVSIRSANKQMRKQIFTESDTCLYWHCRHSRLIKQAKLKFLGVHKNVIYLIFIPKKIHLVRFWHSPIYLSFTPPPPPRWKSLQSNH